MIDDDDELLVVEGLSSAGRPAVRPEASASSPGDAPAPSADTAPAWDGDDRTLVPGSAPVPGPEPTAPPAPVPAPAWDGDDRTLVPRSVPAPSATWDGDDRTLAPGAATGAGAAPTARVGMWDGDDRTIAPASATSSVFFTPSPASPATVALTGILGGRSLPGAVARPPAASGSEGGWLQDGEPGPLSGRTLGDFIVGTVLGEGGMGLVYRAQQVSLRRHAALKVLASNLASDDTLVRRFYAEAHTASRIASEHVVQVYFAGEVDGTVFFAMEFVAGTDLHKLAQAELAAGRKIVAERALDFVAQAADGLVAAALRNVVHRDIKPQNLLVSPEGVVKIADFGIAKALDEQSLTLAGQTVGTPSYCSPEQGRGMTVDHRSDLYSLGVVMYELLTGQKPFAANSPNALIYQHNYAEPKPPSSLDSTIPQAYEAVVMRLLMKDPAQRYQSATDLAADLRRLLAGHAPSVPAWTGAQGTGAKEALARDQGWRRKLLVPALAAMLVIGGGTVWGVAHVVAGRAEQGEIQRRKQNLSTLDHALPPPASAGEDIAWLAPRVGDTETDLVRWQGKLVRVATLDARLAGLDSAGLLPHGQRSAAEADLAAYVAEVGPSAPSAQRWEAVLAATRDEIARLAGELAALDRPGLINHATALRLSAASLRLDPLVAADDADATRWRGILAQRDQRVAQLRDELTALDDATATLIQPRAERLVASLAEWSLLGVADDAVATRWSAVLATFNDRLAGLRARLTRLDRVDQPNLPLVEELAGDLAACRAITAPEDPQRRAWEAKVEATAQRVAVLRGELAGLLDPSDGLSLDRLVAAQRFLGTYRAEVSPDDGRLVAWERRVAAERRDIDALYAAAGRLAQSGRLNPSERTAATAAVAALATRRAAGESELAAWRQRLDDEAHEVESLRLALAAHATAGTLRGATAGETATALVAIAGVDDLASQTLLGQREELLRLAEVLASLDRLTSEPTEAHAKHARWVALTPVGDADGQRWGAKLERIASARAACVDLDGVADPSPACLASLDDLRVALVGQADPEVQRWSTRVADIVRLRRHLAIALAEPVLPPGAAGDLSALAAMVGETAEIAAWRERTRALAGPPRPGWAVDGGHDHAGPWVEVAAAGQRFRLRHVAAGPVALGSPSDERGRDADEGPATVLLRQSFWMAETEVRQRLWQAVMGSNPSTFVAAERPVDCVSWDQAQAFCARLAALVPGFSARLPSEAEWELACRTGSSGPFHGPQGALPAGRLAELAWLAPIDGTRDVGRLAPNRLGLHDMHGNVWEWCADRYDRYPTQPAENWVGARGDQRVVRGGSWADPADALRAANRVALAPGARSRMVGLRIAASVQIPTP